jgi:hypothetical protein
MRRIELGLAVENQLILLTMEDVQDGVPLMLADFRDSLALFHTGVSRYVGLDNIGIIRFGSNPAMISGVWTIVPDDLINDSQKDMEVSSKNLVLRPIE